MKARQNSFRQHAIGRDSLIALVVVSGRDDDQQIEPRKDIKPLTAIAEGGDPAFHARSVRAIEYHFTEIPLTTIFAPVADRHLRLERSPQPIDGYDLLLAGLASLQEQLSDARQIARPHAEAGGEVSLAVGADAP